jgi:hypothetical protein
MLLLVFLKGPSAATLIPSTTFAGLLPARFQKNIIRYGCWSAKYECFDLGEKYCSKGDLPYA